MTCNEARPRLGSGAHDEEAAAHLASCPDCRRWLEGERALTDLLEARLPQHAAPLALKRRLAEKWGAPGAPAPRPRRWPAVAIAVAAIAAAVALWLVRPANGRALAREAVEDHLRILASTHPLDVESGGLHQVKPWFAGRLDFAPALAFAGDDDFPLAGGALALLDQHKAATFVFHRRLHVISLFVVAVGGEGDPAWPASNLDVGGVAATATTVRGYHVLLWRSGGQGYALVSDAGADDLRELARRIVTAR
jgi:anti-sigma factor RsiW